MTHSTSALDRLWQRNGGRGRTADLMQGSAWMRVHEASPALYLDLLGAVHGGPYTAVAAEPCRDGRFRRLLTSFGRSHPVDPSHVKLRPETDHA